MAGVAASRELGRLDTFAMNLRYAARRLARSPGFTLVAIFSLGLGIGANTAMFSLVNAVVIRDQPYEDAGSLVDIYEAMEGFSHGTLSYPDYVDLLEGSGDVFTDVGGTQLALVQVDVDGGVEMMAAEAVTGNYFSVLGIRPAMGRMISVEHHVDRGAHPVVTVSYAFWQNRMAGDPDVVGSELRLSGRPYTVIGVAPADYPGMIRGLAPAFFVPIMMYDELQGTGSNLIEARGNHSFFAKGRLRPGATFAEAEAVGERLTRTLRGEYPDNWPPSQAFVLVPTADVIMNPMIDRVLLPAAGVVMIVVGLVLLIACANLASFLLARAADRRKEIAVRLALGATRRSLIAQLLTETVLLSALGGLLGVLLATQALRLLVAADLPTPLPVTLDLSLDRLVLSFSILVSAGAGILFGLAPALQSTTPDVAPTLRDESAGGGRARGAALRNVLVVGQVAFSVVLLIAAGLFLRSLDASRNIDPGFGSEPTALLEFNAAADRYSNEEGQIFIEALADVVRAMPGVEAVGYTDNLPLNTLRTQDRRVVVAGVEPPPGSDFHSVAFARIDDGFLDAAGIPLLEGRGFGPGDVPGGERVALVSEEFAGRFFPAGDVVGRSITVGDAETVVIGVTADHKVRQIGEDPRPFIFLSHRQSFTSFVTMAARTNGDADALALEMLTAARALDPQLMVVGAKTMERHVATMFIARELGALVIGGFALLALILAAIGLYGVVSYAVSMRTREVGIRLSLGADASSLVTMLTASGMKLVALGAVIGLGLSAFLSRLLSALLYGVPALDPLTFLGVPSLLAVVALAASWIPARRVIGLDPVTALRSE